MLLADRQASRNYRHTTFLGYPDSSLLQLVIAEPDQTVILDERQAVIAKSCNPDGHLAAANRNDIVLLQVLLHRGQLGMEDDLCLFPLNPFRPLRSNRTINNGKEIFSPTVKIPLALQAVSAEGTPNAKKELTRQ